MTLHFLHVGKTGGTAIKEVLVNSLGVRQTPFGWFHHSAADTTPLREIPPEDYFFFCVRDPISRYASAFYSRWTKGRPRYYFEWSEKERVAFERFHTPQQLADALASADREEREAAETAMVSIRHIGRLSNRLGSRELLEERADRIVYVGRQETLPADWQHLRRILELPESSQLPNDPVRAHRGDQRFDRTFNEHQITALRRWYAEDYAIVDFVEQLRQERGWGVEIPDAVPGLAPPAVREPLLPDGPLTVGALEIFRERKVPASTMWSELLQHADATHIAETGIFRGKFAQDIFNTVPSLQAYYLIGPDRRGESPEWGNRYDARRVDADWALAMERTGYPTYPRVLLDGPAPAALHGLDDGHLDAFIFGYSADYTLRGATLTLHAAWSKVKPGGYIGGFGYNQDLFEVGLDIEPGLLFPYALHFAEAMGVTFYLLPNNNFLLVKDSSTGFRFFDATGEALSDVRVLPQLRQLVDATVADALSEQTKALEQQAAHRQKLESQQRARQQQGQHRKQPAGAADRKPAGTNGRRTLRGAAARLRRAKDALLSG